MGHLGFELLLIDEFFCVDKGGWEVVLVASAIDRSYYMGGGITSAINCNVAVIVVLRMRISGIAQKGWFI